MTSAAIPWPRSDCQTCQRIGVAKLRPMCRGFKDHDVDELLASVAADHWSPLLATNSDGLLVGPKQTTRDDGHRAR